MRPPRICFAGGVYHVTVRCNNREFLFKDEQDFQMFVKILLIAKGLYQVRIFAYCLTNNHVHLLICTPDKDNLSEFMQYLNGNFAKAYNRRHGKSGRFWGGRFYSTVIESESQFLNVGLYIELNLVRCKAVKDPADWRWSSYNAHAFGKEDPILDFHPLYLLLGDTPEERQEAYRKMVHDCIEEKGLRREPVYSTGIILGERSFVDGLVELLGRAHRFYKDRKVYAWGDFFSLKKGGLTVPDTS